MHPYIRRLQAGGFGRLRERGRHRLTEIGFGQQGGELRFPLGLGRNDEAPDLLIR